MLVFVETLYRSNSDKNSLCFCMLWLYLCYTFWIMFILISVYSAVEKENMQTINNYYKQITSFWFSLDTSSNRIHHQTCLHLQNLHKKYCLVYHVISCLLKHQHLLFVIDGYISLWNWKKLLMIFFSMNTNFLICKK